jgi:hypothetical protein
MCQSSQEVDSSLSDEYVDQLQKAFSAAHENCFGMPHGNSLYQLESSTMFFICMSTKCNWCRYCNQMTIQVQDIHCQPMWPDTWRKRIFCSYTVYRWTKFHICGKVNGHNIWIWDSENSHTIWELSSNLWSHNWRQPHIIFLQDGVSTHWHMLVRNSMNQMFLGHWIGWRR